jgi:flagellar hook-length control protein FliK
MSIVVNQSIQVPTAQFVAADVVLQPGSVINARVVQILGNDQVRIAIGGQSIDVLSQIPLQAGQALQLAVSQAADGIRLAVVNPQGGASSPAVGDLTTSAASLDTVTLAPDATAGIAAQTTPAVATPTNQLTPQEALAVSTAAQIAATQQSSLAPLFANLGVAAGLDSLPAPVQLAVAQLLAQRTSLDQNLTGADLKQAFQGSGLFLEASLASGSAPSAATPDLKAALIVLRQVLVTSLDGAALAQGATAAPSPTVVQGATVAQDTTSQPVVPQSAPLQPPAPNTGPVLMPVAIVPGQGAQVPLAGLPQPITITDPSAALPTASPALVPLLAPEIGATGNPFGGAALPVVDEVVFDFSAAGQAVAPASTPADAAARAAANTAGLSLLQETLQISPQLAVNPGLAFDDGLMLSLLPAVAGARTQSVDDAFARSNVPPPPISGALPAAQPVMPATLVSNSPGDTAMHHLLADTDGALARQTLLQVASLPDRVDNTVARQDPNGPRWNFEVPFATPRGTAVAQFEISRDGGNAVDAAKRVWRARFSLDIEPAGPVHALVSLNGDKTSVRMWAERPATAVQLRAGASQLTQALVSAELQPGDIVIRDGTPPKPAPAPAGHFLDRAL